MDAAPRYSCRSDRTYIIYGWYNFLNRKIVSFQKKFLFQLIILEKFSGALAKFLKNMRKF